jgi:cytochrome c oxidase subunit 4
MSGHVTSQGTYYTIFGILIALTCLTMGVSFLPLAGGWHIIVGLVIAVCKALLVVLFFMHVLHSPRLTWVIALAGVFWLAIMLFYTLNDYASRGWLPYDGH